MALYASLLFTIINFVAERWQNFVKSYTKNTYQLTRAAMTYFLAAALVDSTRIYIVNSRNALTFSFLRVTQIFLQNI